jgi:polar amino acid transport system permease protein
MANLFDFKTVFEQIPELVKYLPVTLELSVISMILGLVLALLIAVIKMKKVPVLNQIAAVYVSVIRGTPIIVLLYITYFGIPMFMKYLAARTGNEFQAAAVPGFVYAVIALSINESAFNSESIRAALQSVGKGQIEAANALGMTYFQTLRRIIIPEALVVALPTLGNSFIGVIKGTSLAFTCAVVEMTAQGRILSGRTYRYFETYVSLAIIYWVITFVIERVIKLLERKLSIPKQAELVKPAEEVKKEAAI